MKELFPYIIGRLEKMKVRHEVHSFDSGAKMIDIWLGDKFYVIQIHEDLIGLSAITSENISFDTRPDESFNDAFQFKTKFDRIFCDSLVQSSNLKSRSINLSIILSVLSIVVTIIINILIAKEYLRVDGKTQALFGIKEMLQFSYQYYVAGIGLISLVLAIIGWGWSSKKKAALILSLVALIIVFLRIWRLFV